MGISYHAVLAVGVNFEELPLFYQEQLEDDSDTYYKDGIIAISNYYDSDTSDCFIGIIVRWGGEFDYNDPATSNKVLEAKVKFQEIIGIQPRLELMTYVI